MKMNANCKIKLMALNNKVCLWEVAERLGMNDSAFSRKLRKELQDEEKDRILEAIARIAQERQEVR